MTTCLLVSNRVVIEHSIQRHFRFSVILNSSVSGNVSLLQFVGQDKSDEVDGQNRTINDRLSETQIKETNFIAIDEVSTRSAKSKNDGVSGVLTKIRPEDFCLLFWLVMQHSHPM